MIKKFDNADVSPKKCPHCGNSALKYGWSRKGRKVGQCSNCNGWFTWEKLNNPQTDLERFVELYKSFGIDCKVTIDDKEQIIYLCSNVIYNDGIEYTESDKFDGYAMFCSDVTFDKNGKFISQGFWE